MFYIEKCLVRHSSFTLTKRFISVETFCSNGDSSKLSNIWYCFQELKPQDGSQILLVFASGRSLAPIGKTTMEKALKAVYDVHRQAILGKAK